MIELSWFCFQKLVLKSENPNILQLSPKFFYKISLWRDSFRYQNSIKFFCLTTKFYNKYRTKCTCLHLLGTIKKAGSKNICYGRSSTPAFIWHFYLLIHRLKFRMVFFLFPSLSTPWSKSRKYDSIKAILISYKFFCVAIIS